MVFNNLQVEHRGLTAQIDHLVLSRWSAYFIETKSVSSKININADGQWARVYGRKYTNIESPLEQSRRHEAVLFDLLESRLPDFMGKFLGRQKTFRDTLDVHHLVAVSIGAIIQGRGKKAMANHLRPLDQIPQFIAENHQGVRSSLLGSVLASMHDAKTKKRDPAFNPKEFDACRQILLQADISQTPLEQVHAFIESLPAKAATLQDEEPEKRDPKGRPTRAPEAAKPGRPAAAAAAPMPPPCPKCGSPMNLRTASRGDRAGKRFFGCTQFPKCKGIVNLD